MTGSAERPKAQQTIGRFSVVTDPILIRRFQDATLLGESDRTRSVKKLERAEAQRPSGVSIAVPEMVRYNFAVGP